MIAVFALALIVAFIAGAVVESRHHRCPDPNAALLASLDQSRALTRDWCRRSSAWQRAAYRWRNTANDHANVLAALGRVVAEGGTVVPPDSRHPSQRRDEAA